MATTRTTQIAKTKPTSFGRGRCTGPPVGDMMNMFSMRLAVGGTKFRSRGKRQISFSGAQEGRGPGYVGCAGDLQGVQFVEVGGAGAAVRARCFGKKGTKCYRGQAVGMRWCVWRLVAQLHFERQPLELHKLQKRSRRVLGAAGAPGHRWATCRTCFPCVQQLVEQSPTTEGDAKTVPVVRSKVVEQDT